MIDHESEMSESNDESNGESENDEVSTDKQKGSKPHNLFIEYYENQASGKQQQIAHGFYTGLPWQKGYGIGGLLGSIAR